MENTEARLEEHRPASPASTCDSLENRDPDIHPPYSLLQYYRGMSKIAKAFRLDPTAVDHLEALQQLTGSTQASLIEQSLAVYRALLSGGLNNAEAALAHQPLRTPTAAVKASAAPRSSSPSPKAAEG